MEDVTRRLDKFILQIKEIQKPWFTDKENPADVLIVRALFPLFPTIP